MVGGRQTGESQSFTFEVELSDDDVDGPAAKVHVDAGPGRRIAEARIVAERADFCRGGPQVPGSGWHRAMRMWFTDMCVTWDVVPAGHHMETPSRYGSGP